MQMIKTGMNNKQMKGIAMGSMSGKKPLSVPGAKYKKKMTQAQDDAYDKMHNIKEGSKRDIAMDRKNGIKDKKNKADCAPNMKMKRKSAGKK